MQKLGREARRSGSRSTGDVGSGLRRDVKDALGRGLVRSGELDGAIVLVESMDEAVEALARYRARMRDTGYLWMHHPQAGTRALPQPDDARPPRQALGLIDNKTCSIDDERSGIRFVVPRALRETGSTQRRLSAPAALKIGLPRTPDLGVGRRGARPRSSCEPGRALPPFMDADGRIPFDVRYRMLVEHIPAVTYISEFSADAPFLYVSPQIERLLGFPARAGSTDHALWAARMHPADRERVLAARARRASTTPSPTRASSA